MAMPAEAQYEREDRSRVREVDDEELSALRRFASAHGRKWKSVLTEVYWYNARLWRSLEAPDDGPVLHALRNDPRWGHEGLAKFKLPK